MSVNVEPAPSLLSSVMSPPSRRARWRLIGSPRPVPPCWRVLAAVDLPELLEHQLRGLLGDADAGVGDRERQLIALPARADRDPAGLGELDRVAEQVDQDLAQLLLIGEEGRRVRRDLLLEPDLALAIGSTVRRH